MPAIPADRPRRYAPIAADRLTRWLLALAATLLLAGCILAPTKFVSTLDIRADRGFTFTYVGEVQLARSRPTPMFDETGADDGADDGPDEETRPDADEGEPMHFKIAARGKDMPVPGSGADFSDTPDEAQRLQALAGMLAREYGYRSVRYVGNRTLAIDYRISGRLDHGFIFPFHPDGDIVLPFIAIELRGKDRVRIKAPGFASQQSMTAALGGAGANMGMGSGMEDSAALLDGSFTLTTNGEIVSQNQEEGAQSRPDGTRTITWRATPQTRDAPMAVLKLAPLP
jgi:hypothetical protein